MLPGLGLFRVEGFFTVIINALEFSFPMIIDLFRGGKSPMRKAKNQ